MRLARRFRNDEKTEYLPLLRSDVIQKFGLGSEYLAKLPSFKSEWTE